MKRAVSLFLALALICSLGASAFAIRSTVQADITYRDIKIFLNNQELLPLDANGSPVEPFILGGRTYLPVRAVASALGLYVDWDGGSNTVILESGGRPGDSLGHARGRQETRRVELTYRDIQIRLDGGLLSLRDDSGDELQSVEPFILDGTTYLPVRAVSNALGLNVGWDNATSSIYLDKPGLDEAMKEESLTVRPDGSPALTVFSAAGLTQKLSQLLAQEPKAIWIYVDDPALLDACAAQAMACVDGERILDIALDYPPSDREDLPYLTWAITLRPDYFAESVVYTQAFGVDAETRARAEAIVASLITPDMMDYDKSVVLHDYLCRTVRYSTQGNAHSARGALLEGAAACQGYSLAYLLLCEIAGLDCIYLTGYGHGAPHGWNMVSIDGCWYHVDVTWDTPGLTLDENGNPIPRDPYYNYCLATDELMRRDHSWTPSPEIPTTI